MWIPIIRCISKTRCRFSLFPFSRSFCSNSSHLNLFSPSTPLIGHQITDPSSESREIVTSFRDWFRTSKNPLLEKISQILRGKKDEDLLSPARVDEDLKMLDLELSEAFILEVLDYNKKNVLSCLKFFDWAGKQPGFSLTRACYVCIFKILSRAKLTSLMLDLLDTYMKHKHLHTVRMNDILVIGYALAGKVDLALQVFGKMRFHGADLNAVAYHVLLNALIEEGSFDAVSMVLGQIRMRGHESQVTHALVMKNLCKQNRLKDAEEYLHRLVSEGEEVSGHVLGVLVDAICKKDMNMFLHAGKLIQEFGEAGVVSMQQAYGVWIKNLAQEGRVNGAMEFFRTKKIQEGYIPELFRYNFLLNRLLKQNRLQEVCDLLMDMKESGIVPDKVTMNAALCFFCKAGMMDVVLELYKMKSDIGLTPNSLIYNYIINTLCGDGSTDEAYGVLKNSIAHGCFPGKKTFSVLADALCREGKLDKVKDLILFALEHKVMPAVSMYEKFIRALCRAERVEDGYLIHGELSRMNRHASGMTYSHLIKGFNKVSRGDIAARLLIEMQEKGHKPARKIFKAVICCLCEMENPEKHFVQLLEMQLSRYGPSKTIINFFIEGAGHGKRPDLAREVYEMMGRIGVAPNLDSDIVMLQCYLRNDRIADAINFFDDISKRRALGRKVYSVMVVGLCKVGKPDFAWTIMRQERKDGLLPSLQCYEELVKAYCSENRYDDAIEVINDMEKVGRRITSFIGNVLLLHSLQSKDLYAAWARLRNVSDETPTSAMLGRLIAAFSGQIRVDSQVEDLEEVIQRCFPLDLYTYNMMLRKLSIDQIDGALQLFYRLCQKGYEPNRWTYDILVHGLFKHGRITEARSWIEEMLRRGHFLTERTQMFF